MDQWRYELHISVLAQKIAFAAHGLAVLLLASLLFCCPVYLLLLWVIFLRYSILEWINRHRRIAQRQGLLITYDTRSWQWQNRDWIRKKPPLILSQAILIRLEALKIEKKEHLWIMRDSVNEAAWRQLRQSLILFED